MGRFDELRMTQAPDVALAEVVPLIDPAGTTRSATSFSPPLSPRPDRRRRSATRRSSDVFGAQVATEVLLDDAWPALAGALQQAEQLGAHPADLLRQVAAERQFASASSVAEVLQFRVEQRTPNAGDIASSGYPTSLAAAAAPARTTAAGPFKMSWAEQVQEDKARLHGPDSATLGAAVELGRVADAERQASQVSAAASDDVSTPRVDERHEGLSQATVHTDRAAEDQSTATALLLQADTRPLATAGPTSATATAGQSYPTPIKEVSAAQAAPKSATVAAPAARASVKAAPTTGRRRR